MGAQVRISVLTSEAKRRRPYVYVTSFQVKRSTSQVASLLSFLLSASKNSSLSSYIFGRLESRPIIADHVLVLNLGQSPTVIFFLNIALHGVHIERNSSG